MKFENTKVFNFEGAFIGMRNPKNSWHLSDSYFGLVNIENTEKDWDIALLWLCAAYPGEEIFPYDHEKEWEAFDNWLLQNGTLNMDYNEGIADVAFIGPKDMKLAKALIQGGTEHRKFLRQIQVSIDITAPIYWWKEFDTYKIGTTANSTSTMHKLTSKPITLDCFEIDDYDKKQFDPDAYLFGPKEIIDFCESLRKDYLCLLEQGEHESAKKVWKELVRWLPCGWLQTRTVTLNYEVIRNIYHQRKNHKLTEWHSFCKWVESLPYAKELIID